MHHIDKLDLLRVSKNMSIRQLCLSSELSESSVKKILAKKCSPTINSLEKLCSSLGITLAQLFTYPEELLNNITERDFAILNSLRSLSDKSLDALFAFIKSLDSKK